MKKLILTATMVAFGLALLVSCQKEYSNTVPGGKLLLTMEAFGGEKTTKTSVSGNTVQWIGTETVSINENDYTVTVSGSDAYIDGAGIADGALYGYYACGTVENPQTSSPTVTIPSSYSSSYSEGRQVIDLPMAAYSSTKGDALEFKHLTAAVKVTVKNEIGEDGLVIDNVTVSSSTSKLSGALTLDMTDGTDWGVASQSGSGWVTVNLTGVTINSNATREVQVPILPVANGEDLTIRISAHKGSDAYTYQYTSSIPQALSRNKMLTANCSIATGGKVTKGRIVNLATLTDNYEAQDGDVLINALGGNYMISIADDATVTLAGVTIEGINDEDYLWAGIRCIGDATIILADGTTNTVKGFYEDLPGIWARLNYTLTINGTGSLVASSNGCGAGIGGGKMTTFGDIRIEGGNITAIGGNGCAGIGAGGWGSGNITITGGYINATGHKGGPGIGSGTDEDATCGNITISGGTIIASSAENGAGIGTGWGGICGDITIDGGTVTATGGNAGAGIGAGDSGTCGKITIKGGSITATGGSQGAGIGIGDDAICGDISISGGTIEATGNEDGAGIGCSSTYSRTGICGKIVITTDVTRVTATKGDSSTHSIGFGLVGTYPITCGDVEIGGTVYYQDNDYVGDGNTYLATSPFIYPAP